MQFIKMHSPAAEANDRVVGRIRNCQAAGFLWGRAYLARVFAWFQNLSGIIIVKTIACGDRLTVRARAGRGAGCGWLDGIAAGGYSPCV